VHIDGFYVFRCSGVWDSQRSGERGVEEALVGESLFVWFMGASCEKLCWLSLNSMETGAGYGTVSGESEVSSWKFCWM
jgi:hypothetical protein